MKVLLVSGGSVDEKTALAFLDEWGYDKLIGVDRGAKFLYEHEIMPDLLVGDFDSLSSEVFGYFKDHVSIRQFRPEKDATDTEIGLYAALEMGADSIAILGGTGTRIDHIIANIQTLMIAMEQGVDAFILDGHNRIRLISECREIEKKTAFGDYISFFAWTTVVEGLTLEGFKYPLHEYTLKKDNSLGVSNELTDTKAHVSLKNGILLMIESKD